MSSNQLSTPSRVIHVSESPYPLNTKESAIYVDTPSQATMPPTQKDVSTPPRTSSNQKSPSSQDSIHRSPYSPSRNAIPPLPVPENMNIQLKPTIPNSKRKFDINKLVFNGDNSGAALDELKSMLESIQDALVNIVERSKGNSSHIKLFGTQLREFNETFKQRQENEDDLLTTSVYKATAKDLLQDIRLELDSFTKSSVSLTSDTIQELLHNLATDLPNKLDSIHSTTQTMGKSIESIEHNQQQLLQNSNENELQTSINALQELITSKDSSSEIVEKIEILASKLEIDSTSEKLQAIISKQNEINEFLFSKTDTDGNKDLIDALNNMNNDLTKLAEETQNKVLSSREALALDRSGTDASLSKQIAETNSKFEVFMIERQQLDERLQILEEEKKVTAEKHAEEIQFLQKQLLEKDEAISKVKEQQTDDKMAFLEEKLRDLKIQELHDKLSEYEIKEELQITTMEAINKSIEAKAENAKLEMELELKTKALAQLSTTYEAKLEKFISLSNKFEELKAKTDSYVSTKFEKQLINNVRFDNMKYDQSIAAAPPPSPYPSSTSSSNHPLKIQKRNVTLNESMLSNSSKLSPIDMNSYIGSDIYIKSQPEKRKAGLKLDHKLEESEQIFYQDHLISPQKKKVHVNVLNKENQD